MPRKKQQLNSVQQTTLDIIDYFKLVFVAIILIVVMYYVISAFIGQLPAQISIIIIGLAMAFIYATNQKVRESISSWLKPEK
jgi:hypothetical protein